jgi:hypothetical protein
VDYTENCWDAGFAGSMTRTGSSRWSRRIGMSICGTILRSMDTGSVKGRKGPCREGGIVGRGIVQRFIREGRYMARHESIPPGVPVS